MAELSGKLAMAEENCHRLHEKVRVELSYSLIHVFFLLLFILSVLFQLSPLAKTGGVLVALQYILLNHLLNKSIRGV